MQMRFNKYLLTALSKNTESLNVLEEDLFLVYSVNPC